MTETPTVCSPEGLYAGAVAAWAAGAREEAIAQLDTALRMRPHFADALCMGGFMLGESGKPAAALRFYQRALALDPTLAVAHANSGKILFDLGRHGEALAAFDAALALRPCAADDWNNRAGALRELGRLAESAAAARRALRLRPDFAEAALNLGNALLKLDRMDEALMAYRRAQSAKAAFAPAMAGEALALRALGRLPEAMAAFEAAEALGSREAIAGKGCLLLTLGDFERGWAGYEARWVAGKSIAEALGARFPRWSGPGRRGERVLALNDHGLGDTIQFCRYLPLMAEAGVETTFVCPPALHRVLSRLEGVRIAQAPPAGEEFDAQIALSSLPFAFGTRLATIPARTPYLFPEPTLVAEWAERIGPSGLRVGLVWQGNPNPEADMARSLPLAAFAPLAAVGGVRLISLQKGFGEEQLAAAPPQMRIEALGPQFDAGPDAFVDTAAAMASLDLVVTCDTSIAHLAGALGRPVWVALKRDAEWRWLRERADSPWYPTMRLFRQSQRGDWQGVVAAMAAALAPLAAQKAQPRIVTAPLSIGDLIDKITILRLKAARIRDDAKLRNVRLELALLEREMRANAIDGRQLDELTERLAAVNDALWRIEDDIRICERNGDFGPAFIALARAVYQTNDERAAIKRAINGLFQSEVVEEKCYTGARDQSRIA